MEVPDPRGPPSFVTKRGVLGEVYSCGHKTGAFSVLPFVFERGFVLGKELCFWARCNFPMFPKRKTGRRITGLFISVCFFFPASSWLRVGGVGFRHYRRGGLAGGAAAVGFGCPSPCSGGRPKKGKACLVGGEAPPPHPRRGRSGGGPVRPREKTCPRMA